VRRLGARGIRVTVGLALGLVAYHRFARPRHLTWGATSVEGRGTLPGDEIVAKPAVVSTRAVTVHAPPSDIWPWLVQMGEGRGGLYSYDTLDRFFGYLHAPSAERVLPEFQDLAVGDVIPLGRGPSWPVVALERERALVLEPVAGSVSWCFALQPVDAGTTRFVSRVRVDVGPRPLLWVLAPLVDLPWLLMERQMLRGIRRRAEALAVSRA